LDSGFRSLVEVDTVAEFVEAISGLLTIQVRGWTSKLQNQLS